MEFHEDISLAPRDTRLILRIDTLTWGDSFGDGVGIGVIQTHRSPSGDLEWESVAFAGFNDGMGKLGVSSPSPVKLPHVTGWLHVPEFLTPVERIALMETETSEKLKTLNERVVALSLALAGVRATAVTAVTFGDWSSVEASLTSIINDAERALEITA
jgi:hypothetical protein